MLEDLEDVKDPVHSMPALIMREWPG